MAKEDVTIIWDDSKLIGSVKELTEKTRELQLLLDGWNKVEDRLPTKEHHEVLYWDETFAKSYKGNQKLKPSVCLWNDKEGKFDWRNPLRDFPEVKFEDVVKVSHWKPMPSGPIRKEIHGVQVDKPYFTPIIEHMPKR